MKRRPAFTLMELLAVVAILAMLIPVLFRFYSTGVMGLTAGLTEELALDRQSRILLKFLRSDLSGLRDRDSLEIGKDRDEVKLTLITLSPKSRRRLIFTGPEDDLFRIRKDDLQWTRVTYRLVPGQEGGLLVRSASDLYQSGPKSLEQDSGPRAEAGPDDLSSSVALLPGIESMTLARDGKNGRSSFLLTVKVVLKGKAPDGERRTVTGIFGTGAFLEPEP